MQNEPPNHLIDLRTLQNLKKLNVVNPPQEWRPDEDRRRIAEETLKAVPSLQCVRLHSEEYWREGQRPVQYVRTGPEWKEEIWWK